VIVLSGRKAELRAPKVIAEYVRTYLEERKRLAITPDARRHRLEQQLGQLNREIERLADAIAKGTAIHPFPVRDQPPSVPNASEAQPGM
jgi:hypothetical protein